MNNLTLITEKIKESVKPAMDSWVNDMEAFLTKLERYCVHEVYDDPEAVSVKTYNNAYKIAELKRKAGYNASCERFFHRPAGEKRLLLEKEAATKLSKINVAVAKKLKGVNVKDIKLLHFSTTSADYYCEGAWKINDDKVFSFRVIYAGGWNIQVAHVRTLYMYK